MHSIAQFHIFVNPYRALLRQIGAGVARRNDGAEDQAPLSPGLELDILDGDVLDGEVEALGDDLGQNE